jgi:UDP-N-acetylmuramate--alanine ligase
MDIYPAGQQPIEGINSENLLKKIKEAGFKDAVYLPDRSEIITRLASELKTGDVLITLGAGDVYKIGEEILKTL